MSKLSNVLESIFGLEGFTLYDESRVVKKRINGERQQIAFIKILWMAGYLSPFNIWCSIHRVGQEKLYGDNYTSSSNLFNHVYEVLRDANAFQPDIDEFKAANVLKYLFEDMNISVQDIQDLILYWAQTAFGRSFQQERCEIVQEEWVEKNSKRYLKEARRLGITDYISPARISYNEVWILGASRGALLSRMEYLKKIMDAGIIKVEKIKLLAGNKASSVDRELWAEIDGLGNDPVSKLQDGKRYLQYLADKYGLAYDKEKPFIEKSVQGSTRTYLNYLPDEPNRLTESLLGKDMYESIFGKIDETVEIIVFTRTKDGYRPTTISTALDAADSLIDQLRNGKYKNMQEVTILAITNQPYVLRQSSEVREAIFSKLAAVSVPSKTVILDETGNPISPNLKIQIMHSEIAALFGDRYKRMHRQIDRKIETLMYSSRMKGIEGIPEYRERTDLVNFTKPSSTLNQGIADHKCVK